jgi:large conductance mechanosensitive channel
MADSTKKQSRVSAARSKAASKARAARSKAAQQSSKHTSGFADFIRNKGVVGLAIGLAVGTVASGTVKTIVEGFVNPAVQFLIGTHRHLELQVWHVDLWGRTADFQWGASLSSLITLVATIFVIYVIFRVAKLDQLEKSDTGPIKIPKPKA